MKITGVKQGQAKITISSEIIKLKGWTDDTEIYFTPFISNPNEKITKDTPIILKEIESDDNGPKKKK